MSQRGDQRKRKYTRMSSQTEKAIKKADRYNTASETLRHGNIAQRTDLLGLYGQVNKRIRGMPRQ